MEPQKKDYEPEDPMALHPYVIDGDQNAMLESIIEEYSMMGWNGAMISKLFDNPFFRATHGLKARMGKDEICRKIDEVIKRVGVLRFETSETKPAYLGGNGDA